MVRNERKQQRAAARQRWTTLWLAVSLAALAFAVYANCLSNGFVSDDNLQLLTNPVVTDWHSLPAIMNSSVWANAGIEVTNYYRPLQLVLYMAIYYLKDQTFDAFSYHLLTVLLHMINTVLLFLLARRMLRDTGGTAAAWVAAALFAVHPIHTEAVVWVAALPDVLITLTILIAVLLFDRQEGSPRGWQIAVHAGLYLLCLLAKETGAVLLALLGGYEWLYLRRPLRELLWRNRVFYGTMLATFVVYMVLRVHALGSFAPAQNLFYHLAPTEYFLSMVVILGEYLGKLLWPTNLNYFHMFDPTTHVDGAFVAAFLGVLAAMALWIGGLPEAGDRLGRWRPLPVIAYGVFWTLIPLAPVMNLTGVGENVFTERYLYLPSAGFLLAAAAAWHWIWSRQKQAAWILTGLCLAAGSYGTVVRNSDWSDDLKLFTVTAQQSPRSAMMVNNVGLFYYERGQYPQAIEMYKRAIELKPDTAMFYGNLGNALSMFGLRDEGVANLKKALELKPGYWQAWTNLALVLDRNGDVAGAVAAYQRALQIRPDYPEALTGLAMIRMRVDKDYPGAIELLRKAVETHPTYTEASIDLGLAYSDTQQWPKAVEAYQHAIRVGQRYPGLYSVHYNLGLSYSKLNLLPEALTEFRRALRIRPDFTQAKQAADKIEEELRQQGRGS